MTVMLAPSARATGWSAAREVGFPALSVAVIVGYADLVSPMGLPGHRGLVWLTLLVAVTVLTRRRETVLAVGAVSTAATLLLDLVVGPWIGARYLAAAALLYAVAAVPAVGRRPWMLALAAGPIHLVALAGSVVSRLGAGAVVALAPVGLADRALFHVGFGLAAGLLGWAIATGADRFSSPSRARFGRG